MKKLLNTLERLTVAVTFAEANDHQTARYYLRPQQGQIQDLQRSEQNRAVHRQREDRHQQDLQL